MDNDDRTYCSIFALHITYLSNVAVPWLSRQFRRQHDHHSSYSTVASLPSRRRLSRGKQQTAYRTYIASENAIAPRKPPRRHVLCLRSSTATAASLQQPLSLVVGCLCCCRYFSWLRASRVMMMMMNKREDPDIQCPRFTVSRSTKFFRVTLFAASRQPRTTATTGAAARITTIPRSSTVCVRLSVFYIDFYHGDHQ